MYKLIFTSGGIDDTESLMREIRSDVLLMNEKEEYYYINFLTLNRIRSEFDSEKVCYLEDNLVVLHEITRDNILKSAAELIKWMFDKRWRPLTEQQLAKYYSDRSNWEIISINIPD